MRPLTGCILMGALLTLAGIPAGAIDNATGVYEGKMACRQIAGGVASKSKQDVTISLSETMSGISLDVVSDGVPVATALRGFVAADSSKDTRAKLTGVQCGLSVNNHVGAAVHADVAIQPGSEKGKLKGTLLLMDDQATSAELCSFSAKRVATVLEMIAPCV